MNKRVLSNWWSAAREVRALEWAYLAVGLALVHRYRFLFDDAFIYFRYVDNLLHLGLGLVYNAGEYVEGYSSPAQVLTLIALRSLGLAFPTAVWGLGYASFALFWVLLVRLNRRWSPHGPTLNLPLAVLCANYGLTTFFTSGLETPLVHITAAAYALAVADPKARLPRAFVYASPLVRPELALALILFVLYRYFVGRESLVRLLPWPAALNGGWLAFRIVYYADLVPNTYYLKDDVEPLVGLRYLWDLQRAYHVGWLLLLGLLLAVALVRQGRRDVHPFSRGFLAVTAAAVASYIVKVGGAPMHYWYLAFAFTLSIATLAGLLELALQTWGGARALRLAQPMMLLVVAGSFALLPAQLAGHPALGQPEHTIRDLIIDAAVHRDSPRYNVQELPTLSQAALRRAQASDIAHRGYPSWTTENWCRTAYLKLDTGIVHSLGLTDKILAHADVPEIKQGHKIGLVPLARDLLAVHAQGQPGRGMYAAAVEAGQAAPWIAINLSAIERLEAKIYNRHNPFENLRLAVSPRVIIEAAQYLPDNLVPGARRD